MCAWNEDDVAEVIAAADGCACSGRWCEVVEQIRAMPIEEIRAAIGRRRAGLPFPTVLDTVRYQTRDE